MPETPWEGLTIPGDGFALRRWHMDDIDSLIHHANDERVSRTVSDRFPWPYTRDDAHRFLAGKVVDPDTPVFAIEVEGSVCGGIGARPGTGERAHSAEFGYWLGRAFWGKGLMSRVVGVYAPWLVRELRLYRLWASVLDGNPASAGVLLRNGFVEEGVNRQAVLKRGRLHDLRIFARLYQDQDHD